MRGEHSRRVMLYALALTLLTLLPYGIGWLRAGDDWLFNGFTFGLDDGNAYLGKMRIGLEGGWRFYLFYTPEAHKSAFGLYLPHILIGHVVRWLVNPSARQNVTALAIAFQLWRMLACFLMIVAIDRFISIFLRSRSTRWLALIIATLGGGLGWLLILIGKTDLLGTLPVDFYIPEGFSFLALYGLPHVAMGRAALLLGFVCLFAALRKNDWRLALLAGLCWNVVGLMVTFYLAVLYVLLAAWGAALWLRLRRFPTKLALWGGLAAGLTLPLFAYNSWLFQTNEAFAQWSRQNYLPSPHPLHYLIGYGVLALFAFGGGRWAWERANRPNSEPYALLVAWVVIAPVLVYLPLNVQRRLGEGVLIPLAILAAVGVKLSVRWLWSQKLNWRRRFARTRRVLLLVVLPSTFLLWLIPLVGLLNPDCTGDVCLYRSRQEVEALDWLAARADKDTVVLGSFRTGNFLPIQTDLRPFYGHGPETLYSEEKEELVKKFYVGGLSGVERDKLLQKFHIRYVIFGTLERELGADPSVWDVGMRVIYDQQGYTIYEVQTP